MLERTANEGGVLITEWSPTDSKRAEIHCVDMVREGTNGNSGERWGKLNEAQIRNQVLGYIKSVKRIVQSRSDASVIDEMLKDLVFGVNEALKDVMSFLSSP